MVAGKHTVEVVTADAKSTRKVTFAAINAVVRIDGIECPVEVRCRRTGRQVDVIDHQGPVYQVYWSLRFDNPEIRKHPDYKEIRDKVCKEFAVSTVNFNLRKTKDGKRIALRSGRPVT